jgi:subtilisin-like proprotein convertase family protein
MTKTLLLLTALPALTLTATAAVTETFNFNALNLAVPDGNPAGLANNQSISSTIVSIDSVVLTLNISGTFNGDLYGYVTHSSGFTVLLNRPGKSASSGFGYDDDGFSVTFDDTAAADIHTYRNSDTPGIGTPLSGLWQPDGRNVDPADVTEASARTAMLSSFNLSAAAGDWTLFLADTSSGDTHTLQSWTLSITGTAIPEPGALLLALAGGMALLRRRR